MDYIPIFWDIETTGTNPLAQHWWSNTQGAQVTAVGVGAIENWEEEPSPDEAEYDVSIVHGDDEYKLLTELGERMRSMDYDKEPFLVGYNTRKFDHPYLGARFARKRLDGEPFASEWKRLDMMRVANKDDGMPGRYHKEDEYAEHLGIGIEDELEGKDMPEAFENGEWDKIKSHVRKDVEKSILMFLERQELMMETFYDHYNINADGGVVEEIDIPTED